MKTYGELRSSSIILDYINGCKWVVSFTPLQLYTLVEELVDFIVGLDAVKSELPCSYRESNRSSLTIQLVLTELSQTSYIINTKK
jgi:hypothetical protein